VKLIYEEAQAALSKARDDMTRYADFHRGQVLEQHQNQQAQWHTQQ